MKNFLADLSHVANPRGYAWPKRLRSKAEESLRPLVPATWGTQHGSACVICHLPHRILQAKTDNMVRLLLAWYRCDQAAHSAHVLRAYESMPLPVALPPSPLWRPVAITVMPSTDLVVRALHTGVLFERLKCGLERIYVSQMAWIRAPSIEMSLRALAHRFPKRLVLVRAEAFRSISRVMRITRVRAAEYQFIGSQLRDRYLEDFGYDMWDNRAALEGTILLRIGEVPRGSKMLILREMPVAFDLWKSLDVDGMLALVHAAEERCEARNRKAMEAITFTAPLDGGTEKS